MFPKSTYTQKNKLLIPVAVVGLLLCWFLAFGKTFEAIRLNKQLSNEAVQRQDISFNPVYLKRKEAALDKILKGYQVTPGWTDQLWMKGSTVAVKYQVGVDYTLARPTTEVDSTATGPEQSLYFYGGYKQLVQVMDTLERMQGIGRISAVQVKAPGPDLLNDKAGKNSLRLDFKGINKN